MNWTQTYDTLGDIWLSAIIAALPIVFFFLALTLFKMKGYVAATMTVAISALIAIFFYHMPAPMAASAAGYGFAYGLWPISYIVVAAVFLYKLSVKSGQFDIIRRSIVSITDDPRLQMLLVAFSFNAFLEGAAGFGAPIAITAALLVGLGFNPLKAAGLCLIANTASGAFGAMGIPIIVAGQVSGISPLAISKFLGTQLPVISFVVPFLLVAIMDGWKGLREVWPAAFVSAITYAAAQYFTVTFMGPELPDIISSIVSMIALALFVSLWQPKGKSTVNKADSAAERLTVAKVLKAWSPFIMLTVMVTVWSSKLFKSLFDKGGALQSTIININIPGLHNQVIKAQPIVSEPTPYAAVLKLDFLSATGTAIVIAAVLSMLILHVDMRTGWATLKETVQELTKPIVTIMMVLGFAFVANYSGLSSTLGLALASTARLFPFLSPALGWIGVFLTGSVVSNNALFGNLQFVTAEQISVLPLILVAANTAGGVMAKMISPQSIAVATGAVGLAGREGELFRFTMKYSMVLLVITGAVTLAQAFFIK
ncbi:lactate permease LctP family transporter [Aneurinibacillus sp. Ricciae_BoGa-3]|uniref:lactate permease LctP family transporter n=1 Tax=Aneurinibacillus sp. Ricciae_BoGa-3 TaxID=3022697 RepID=UPI0023421C30|nr:lactate permease LctP family transporter [Aneurinibacillus sp. Ricciae_BoGa-3]WCK54580.1 lactate permease LctP family transporter [Aneurinibacillus sp. Ricciae_BoGa-3]